MILKRMINTIPINDVNTYIRYKSQGFEPLVSLIFKINFELRLKLQNELFGEMSPENDIKYYKYMFHVKPNICEETDQPLVYDSKCVSHILTRGAHPALRYDLRNNNLVIPKIHNIWDHDKESEKKKLKIYYKNQLIIELLKKEYYLN